MKAKVLFLLLVVAGMVTTSYGQDKLSGNKQLRGGIPEIDSNCDSIITVKDGIKKSKEVFGYNEWGNAIYYAKYKWEANKWKGYDYSIEQRYDANGNLILWIYYEWDDGANDWLAGNKEEYSYDEHNNQTAYISYDWDKETSSYVKSSETKYEYEYNAQGKKTLMIVSKWNKTTDSWSYSYKHEYQYDTTGNLLSDIELSRSAVSWLPDYKYEYEYDALGRETMKAFYGYNPPSSDFSRKINKYETVYDAQGRKLSYSYFTASNNNNWKAIPNHKEEYAYDEHGNNTVMEYKDNSTSNKSYKYTYGYDAANKKVSALYYGYKQIMLGYVTIGNPPSSVPYYVEFSDWTYPVAYGYDSHNRLKTEITQSPAYEVQEIQNGYNIIWKTPNIYVKTYYYSGESNGVEPVATGDEVVVSTQYYDLLGRTVKQPQAGKIYIAKEVYRSGKTETKKIVK